MNTISAIEKIDCAGCKACFNICPQHCINLVEDPEGFRYPQIDEQNCIHCGLCYSTCIRRPRAGKKQYNTESYLSYAIDEQLVKESSSGGIFTLLAQTILNREGVVYGAALEHMTVRHIRVDSADNLSLLRKSKYRQSDIELTYVEAKKDLIAGKNVLFSGTPCQIAGLYAFLGKEYENLYTCDVVCHGVPSDLVFRKYLEKVERKNKGKIVSMVWRDKKNGWHRNTVTECFDNGKQNSLQSNDHPYQRGFLFNYYLRPSCHRCKFTGFPRVADISLADGWKAEKFYPEFAEENNDRGMSYVLISSEKGKELYSDIRHQCIDREIDIESVKQTSRHAYLPPEENPKREAFFADINKSFAYLEKKYIFSNVPKEKISRRIKIFLWQITKGRHQK